MGKPRIVAETGAGQHGVASATVAAHLGLECVVYMGVDDMARQSSGLHQGGQASDLRLMSGLGGEVPRLVGVLPQVEQLAVIDGGIDDELPVRCAPTASGR